MDWVFEIIDCIKLTVFVIGLSYFFWGMGKAISYIWKATDKFSDDFDHFFKLGQYAQSSDAKSNKSFSDPNS